MACKDCLNNCPEVPSDRCVLYTGPELPFLGICPGDALSEFEAAVAANLQGILQGTGISPANVTVNNCAWLKDRLGMLPPTMSNLFQLLIDASCTLKELIDQIDAQIGDNPVFNTACLTGLPANPTRDDILQSAITLLCAVKVTVDAIPATYVKLSDLTNLVTQIVNNINGGGSTIIQNSTKMIPYTAVAYFGPLSNFDASGKGIAGLGYDKIYLCNGSNGTPDVRGRTIVGALRNVPGGTPDAAVDPANPNNPNWALNDKNGSNFHVLTPQQLPAHNHPVNDPGHKHTLTYGLDEGGNRSGNNWMKHDSNIASRQTQVSTTGISIGNTGANQPHNNIQPSIAGYYIMYIP